MMMIRTNNYIILLFTVPPPYSGNGVEDSSNERCSAIDRDN